MAGGAEIAHGRVGLVVAVTKPGVDDIGLELNSTDKGNLT